MGSPYLSTTGCDSPSVTSSHPYSGFPSHLQTPFNLASTFVAHPSSSGLFHNPQFFAYKESVQAAPETSSRVSDSVDLRGTRSEEDYDENSVNIDGFDEDDDQESSQKQVNPSVSEQNTLGYSDFSAAPFNSYHEDRSAGFRDEVVTRTSENDRNRGGSSFSDLSPFSAFRYLHHQNHQGAPSLSPKRYSPGINSEGPENPSSKTTMLEHKLPFNFLGPPLAALHSMTEMKSSLGGGHTGGDSNNNSTSAPSMSSPNAGLTAQTMHGQANAPNPHGIDTILSRPPPVTSAGLSSLTAGECPHRRRRRNK